MIPSDFDAAAQKILKEFFGDTNGPITTSGQKILIAQHLPDTLVDMMRNEFFRIYNEGWTDAVAFISTLEREEPLLESGAKDKNQKPDIIIHRHSNDIH